VVKTLLELFGQFALFSVRGFELALLPLDLRL
jgi:hypothetical protein